MERALSLKISEGFLSLHTQKKEPLENWQEFEFGIGFGFPRPKSLQF